MSLLSNSCYINYPCYILLFDNVCAVIIAKTTDVQQAFMGKPDGKGLLQRHVEMEGKKLIFRAEDEGCGFDMDTEWDFMKALMKNLMPQDTGIS
jgi:hypothetical protein